MSLAFACTRFHATPVVERALLQGTWRLDNHASNVHYHSFTQTIEQTAARVTVRQRCVRNGTARWQNGSLALALHGPGAHSETVVASVRGNRLVCEGNSDGKRYHAEFERIDRSLP